MTLIVGIVCRDGIAIASDSQTTYGTYKTRDAEKIRVVKFHDLTPILVAHAGAEDISNRVLATMEALAQNQDFESENTAVFLVQRAMQQVREELRQQHCNCTAEQLRHILQDAGLDCDFMLAYFFKSKPLLYTFRFQDGISTPARSYHASIGIGADVSNFIISEFSYPQVSLNVGMSLTIYAAKKVAEHVRDCAEPIRAAWIKPVPEWIQAAGTQLYDGRNEEVPHRYHVLPQDGVDSIINLIGRKNDKMKRQRVKFIEETFRRDMERFLIEYTRSP